MSNQTVLKISLVPIWILFLLASVEYIFGLISEPDTPHVIMGVLLLCVLIGSTLILFNKIYLKNE